MVVLLVEIVEFLFELFNDVVQSVNLVLCCLLLAAETVVGLPEVVKVSFLAVELAFPLVDALEGVLVLGGDVGVVLLEHAVVLDLGFEVVDLLFGVFEFVGSLRELGLLPFDFAAEHGALALEVVVLALQLMELFFDVVQFLVLVPPVLNFVAPLA